MNYDILNDEHKFNSVAKSAFDKTDINNNGSIEINEFEKTFLEITDSLGFPKPSKIDIQNVFKGLDIDKSGTISFEEFKVFVRKFLEIELNQDDYDDQEN